MVFVMLFFSVRPFAEGRGARTEYPQRPRQLDFAFWMLAAAYAQVSRGNVVTADRLFM